MTGWDTGSCIVSYPKTRNLETIQASSPIHFKSDQRISDKNLPSRGNLFSSRKQVSCYSYLASKSASTLADSFSTPS
jgi:hypothetical protein